MGLILAVLIILFVLGFITVIMNSQKILDYLDELLTVKWKWFARKIQRKKQWEELKRLNAQELKAKKSNGEVSLA